MKKDSGLIMLCRWVVDDCFDSTGGDDKRNGEVPSEHCC